MEVIILVTDQDICPLDEEACDIPQETKDEIAVRTGELLSQVMPEWFWNKLDDCLAQAISERIK